jgi:hypothetical protein
VGPGAASEEVKQRRRETVAILFHPQKEDITLPGVLYALGNPIRSPSRDASSARTR